MRSSTLLAVAIFGWLLERRHGPAVVLVVFFGAGATGALVASAVYAEPLVSGANGAALGLLAAWAVPDLIAARAGDYYEGDLLGVAAIAALLLALPYARPEASWLAGVTGAVVGLLLGFGMYRWNLTERVVRQPSVKRSYDGGARKPPTTEEEHDRWRSASLATRPSS